MKPTNRTGKLLAPDITRRSLFSRCASGILLAAAGSASASDFHTRPGAFAEALTQTVPVEEGPFYPYHRLPLDTDNDLLIVNNAITPAVGEITHLSGRLLDARGEPIRNATIEIWQVDHNAVYLAERGSQQGAFDGNFQGFGRFLTSSTGEYYFRTIKPVPYHSRPAPHIHFKVTARGRQPFTTQLFIKGHPGNLRDGVYNQSGPPAAMTTVSVPFTPIKSSQIHELAATFNIVRGITPRS